MEDKDDEVEVPAELESLKLGLDVDEELENDVTGMEDILPEGELLVKLPELLVEELVSAEDIALVVLKLVFEVDEELENEVLGTEDALPEGELVVELVVELVIELPELLAEELAPVEGITFVEEPSFPDELELELELLPEFVLLEDASGFDDTAAVLLVIE